MAIRSYKNNINTLEFRGQRVSSEDLSFFGAGLDNIEFTAEGKNVVVTKIYDGSNNLLNIKFEKATPPTDPATGEFFLRPDLEINELGYQSGTFRVEYNFWKFMIGSDFQPGVFIKDISTSKTEVRILPNPTQDTDIDLLIKKDFFNFANLVLDSSEFNVLLDDIFNDIDIAVTINKLDIVFLDRLYTDFQLNDISFADTLNNIFILSRENMLLRLLERGFVGYGEFIRLFDTTMKEAIHIHFGDGTLPNQTEVLAPEDVNSVDSLQVSPIDQTTVINYDDIATSVRKTQIIEMENAERLARKNRN